jgi:hypothetical protein
MPPRIILLIPCYTSRCAHNFHSASFRTAQESSFAFHETLARVLPFAPSANFHSFFGLGTICSTPTLQLYAPVLCISIGALQRAFNARDEVEVAVKCRGGG